MKSLLRTISIIAVLTFPLSVCAEDAPDYSGVRSPSPDEAMLAPVPDGGTGTGGLSGPDASADETGEVLSAGGDRDVYDEILFMALAEESRQGGGPLEYPQPVLLARADDLQPETADRGKERSSGRNDSDDSDDSDDNRIADPLYYLNAAMYHINDKLHFWLIKPLARGYAAVVPEPVRLGVSNFFHNLKAPVRIVGSLLQLKLKNAADELVRFVTNSTQGLGGFFDVARSHYGVTTRDEDIGQALGSYGIGHGIYLVLPFWGPSSLRDTVGLAGQALLNPVNYINPIETAIGIDLYDRLNEFTFHIGDYEAMKKAAIDPYVSMRNGYLQHRKKQVEE